MTDKSKEHFNEKDVSKWVRELPPATPDPDFRERLRAAFASGQLEPSRPGKIDDVRGLTVNRWWRWAVPAAAAAVVLFAVLLLNRGPALRVAEVVGTADVRIDGQTLDLDDIDALNSMVRSGAEIEVPPGTTVDLAAHDVVLYEVVGGTRMTLPRTPGRWFDRAAVCTLYVGELRLKTGSRFAGSQLRVYTPEGIVEVTGTLLSVQCDSGGTCVCVLEGIARVGVDEDDLEPVEPGYRKIMLRDGTVEIIPVKPMHRDGVLDFDKRVGHRIGEER
ncbi:MAG: hypothetical protein JSW58_12850 [Candidatus Latescibacterota bacterium]|nr:MAG: hypothetical protein JSW58_12850 [Candidatus Latescibacterota bacterium]